MAPWAPLNVCVYIKVSTAHMNLIIIPYRNRQDHLKTFLKSVPEFKKHLSNFKLLVVEQTKGKEFNRGKLLNVGFHYAMETYVGNIVPRDVIVCFDEQHNDATDEQHNDATDEQHNDATDEQHNDATDEQHNDASDEQHNDASDEQHNDATDEASNATNDATDEQHNDATDEQHNDATDEQHNDATDEASDATNDASDEASDATNYATNIYKFYDIGGSDTCDSADEEEGSDTSTDQPNTTKNLDDVYIFIHDVDWIPKSNTISNDYTKTNADANVLLYVHDKSTSPVCKIKSDVFRCVNGFPNTIYEWGVEDRVLYYRIMKHPNKYKLERIKRASPKSSSLGYTALSHTRKMSSTMKRSKEVKKFDEDTTALFRQGNQEEFTENAKLNGLTTLEYTLRNTEWIVEDVVEKILVDV
jgi:hypothetical protein